MDFDVLLVDIEGTTTSIAFVKDVLFPYARKEVENFLRTSWNSDVVQEDIQMLRIQAGQDVTNGINGITTIPEGVIEEVLPALLSNVNQMMNLDRKVKALKQLQGHIWIDGYKAGVLKGHVYPDVKPAIEELVKAQKKVYVYSSGSVEAQKLLFGNSEEGNMLELFSGHFDTTVGLKVEAESYRRISEQIGADPSRILFLTDIPKEADAAAEAGFQVRLLSRPGNSPLTEADLVKHKVIDSFANLFI